jgi:prepilin-type processing-associated H-X9-DG protein
VRPGVAYQADSVWSWDDRRVKGNFRVIGCPTVVTPNPTYGLPGLPFSPHDQTLLLAPNVQAMPTVRHGRNYGYPDGHVAWELYPH